MPVCVMRAPPAFDRKCDSEVGHERLTRVQQNVLGFQVSVDDAALVCVIERAGDGGRDADRLIDGKLSLAIQTCAQ
jgi:hypothetical protein